jgi:carboxypeptidase Taq
VSDNLRKNYDLLVEKLEENSRLSGIMGTLHWDQEVIMPSGGAEARSKQMSSLAGVLHEKSTAPELGACLEKLSLANEMQFNPHEWCNIHEAKRDYDLETKVPKPLVKEMAELGSKGHFVWSQARRDNRFLDFAPVLSRFVELKKQWAACVRPDWEAYDANIDLYERGTRMAEITPLFERLKEELIPLLASIAGASNPPDASFLEGDFPIDRQEALGRRISEAMGFSFDRGRMDVSVHPFCGGGHPTDVRITTRYRKDNFIESLYAVIHETGHGLYEQGRMQNEWDLPVSEPLTMGIHESQSLFWERMVAQSSGFCGYYLETFKETFPAHFDDIDGETLYRAVNKSQPGCIRVEADEVSYPMHVILRYEIEKGLFDGSIPVQDLPEIWNHKIKAYLGVVPASDTLGVLQDVHWSGGAFGYFPSYTLGAMYACQFFNTLKNDLPEVEQHIQNGNFAPIKSWLNEKIHVQGSLFSPSELVRRVTGEPLNPERFVNYLKNKYNAIYNLNQGL